MTTLIFERSAEGRRATSQAPRQRGDLHDVPDSLVRKQRPLLP